MTARGGVLVAVVFVLVAAGCGGSRDAALKPKPSTRQTGSTNHTTIGAAALDVAARKALRANYTLSLYVLWHNELPRWARQSTRGPALVGLRSSAEGRKKRGIRIRVLDRKLTIVALKLDPSYTRATATIQSLQHLRPYRSGHSLGRAIKLDERAYVELRRIDSTSRFIVWKVGLLK